MLIYLKKLSEIALLSYKYISPEKEYIALVASATEIEYSASD